jgi:SAM-dependent methyltransferase
MNYSVRRCVACMMVVALAPAALLAQTAPSAPVLGQPGKDVIWLPSPQVLVERMLDMAKVTSGDTVLDLGSGDGRVVIAAAKRGALAMGVEYDARLVDLARQTAAAEGVNERAVFTRDDLFETDLSKATVITLFLRDDLNLKLRPRLLALKPGTRVVSNTFSMAEWEPDDFVVLSRDCAHWCSAMMWIVPASVGGTWHSPQGDVTLSQAFQQLKGSRQVEGTSVALRDGRLRGDDIVFSAGAARYSGRVHGNTITGTVTEKGRTVRWSAVRSAPTRK